MMKKDMLKKTIVASTLINPVGGVLATEYALDLELGKDNRAHYDTNVSNLTLETLREKDEFLPGLFRFKFGKIQGKSAIYPELNNGSFTNLSSNKFLSIEGNTIGFEYGAKEEFDWGKLIGGVGFEKTKWSTNCEINHCKEIKFGGFGIKVGAILNDDSQYFLDYKDTYFKPTQYHALNPFLSPVPLKESTSNNEKIINIKARSKKIPLDLSLDIVEGDMSKTYSILLDSQNFDYFGGELGLFYRIDGDGKSISFGPYVGFGSLKGSLASLENNQVGLGLNIYDEKSQFSAKIYGGENKGGFSNSQFLTEESIDVIGAKILYNEFLSNDKRKVDTSFYFGCEKRDVVGNFTMRDGTLIFVTGGINHRNMDEFKECNLGLEKRVSGGLTFGADLKTYDHKSSHFGNSEKSYTGNEIFFSLKKEF